MTPVTVRFIGSGDAFGTGGRLNACILLDGAPGRVLLDCGATSLVGLKQAGIDPSSIDVVLLSHLHGDHFGGLPFLILDGKYAPRTKPLLIAGPAGTAQRLRTAMAALYPGSEDVEQKYGITHLEFRNREELVAGPASVVPFPAVHSAGAPTHMMRVSFDSKLIAYTGDTGWTDEIPDVAANADLFISECSSEKYVFPYHLSHDELASKAHLITARRTFLTHMGPSTLALAGTVFPRAHDGLAVEI